MSYICKCDIPVPSGVPLYVDGKHYDMCEICTNKIPKRKVIMDRMLRQGINELNQPRTLMSRETVIALRELDKRIEKIEESLVALEERISEIVQI